MRYINIQAWLRGFQIKIANFSSFSSLSIPKRDLDTKKTTPNIEVWPESLGAMLEYWYIECGLLECMSKSRDQITANNVTLYILKRTGGKGWAGAFQNVVVRKHMTHPFHLAQNWVTHP